MKFVIKTTILDGTLNNISMFQVTDIRALKYTPPGEIFYKLKFTEEYQLLSQRKNARIDNIPFHNLPKLYNERRKITKKVLRFTATKELNAKRLPKL